MSELSICYEYACHMILLYGFDMYITRPYALNLMHEPNDW